MKLMMMTMVLALSACAGGTDSAEADTPVTYETTATTDGGSFTVSYTTDPAPIPTDDYFTVTATVAAAGDGALLSGAVVEMDADMPSHGHGMNVSPETTDGGDGTYSGSPFLFHMTGDWRLRFAVTRDGVTETAEMFADCCE